MNTLVLLLISIAVLFCGYVMYGGWLVKQWGVGEGDIPTPAHALEDGVDYVPAKAPVLMGHHFSSIAGAGPITGPIGAAMFGWLPVTLWILIGVTSALCSRPYVIKASPSAKLFPPICPAGQNGFSSYSHT